MNHDKQYSAIIHLATLFFIIAAFGLFVDGARNILSAALRGFHDSKTPMIIGVICLWAISLPASYLMGIYFHGGPVILRIAFLSGILLATVFLFFRLQKRFQ